MIRVTTANSVYLYEEETNSLVCLAGTHAGLMTHDALMRRPTLGCPWRSYPDRFFIQTSLVLEIALVEN